MKEFTIFDKDNPACVTGGKCIVGYHQDRGTLLADLLHAAVALGLEKYVAYG